MERAKSIQLLCVLIITLFFPLYTFAIDIFASNNTQEINIQTALNRLLGEEQDDLLNQTIELMQKEHIEQSRLENVLGAYTMASTQKVTADNSEKITTSSYQNLTSYKIFKILKKLANTLNQESIAVFIPNKESSIGDIIVQLKSHDYSIDETVAFIQNQLPSQYSQAFSLYLSKNTCGTTENTKVTAVEWIGSKINPEDIKHFFPQENAIYRHGKAYLIYKNGKKEPL